MADFKDIEVRIRGAKAGGNGQPSLHDVEVRFNGSGLWRGESEFDFDVLDLSDPEGYGKALGCQLASPNVQAALETAGLTRGESIRLRLLLDDDANVPHSIRWERIWLTIGGAPWRLAASPNVTFSRYIPVQNPDEEPPDVDVFSLLLAVANPIALRENQRIDVETEIAKFLEPFENGPVDRRLKVSIMPGRTGVGEVLTKRIYQQGWSVLSGPSTLQRISSVLHQKYHGLHILAHGDFNAADGIGSLLLENEQGGKDEQRHEQLQSWITVEMKLIIFQACLSAGAPREGDLPFTSLAPRLVQMGLPAAVAMQDFVRMDDARVFFTEFYRTLLDEGQVDVAVNCGRQALIQSATLDSWSIPALFSRLRGGLLWRPDALRQAVREVHADLPVEELDEWPPVQIVEHTRGLADYSELRGASGPRFDLWNKLCELSQTPESLIVLTGPRGFSKTVQLRRLFRTIATDFLRSIPNAPIPVHLTLRQLSSQESGPWKVLQRVWAGTQRSSDLNRVEGRQFLVLIDGEEEATAAEREDALEAIRRLRALAGSRVFIVADEGFLPFLNDDFGKAVLLVTQPLEWPQVSSFLERLGTQTARTVRDAIRDRGYADLASQPRLLQHMLQLTARGASLKSRCEVLRRVTEVYLARIDTRRIPRSCAESALQRIAWDIQTSRAADLTAAQLVRILDTVRDGREIPRSALRSALVEESGLLVSSGEEGVRFPYPAIQFFFAARHLMGAPDRQYLLEDIAASLGRLARVRRWENVLVLVASLLPSPEEVLRTVLAGSSLMEGEQVFLAVRCYQEALASEKRLDGLHDIVDQMIDTLIWRSSWDPQRPYGDRRKALDRLVELAPLCERRQSDIIAHCIRLACDPVHRRTRKKEYDWAGIRQAATDGLFRLATATVQYVRKKRKDLHEPLEAWVQLEKNVEGMKALLLRDDPRVSVIAAFALGQSGCQEHQQMLVDAYEEVRDLDLKWGIVTALSGLEAPWVQQNVIQKWIAKDSGNDAGLDELRSGQTCFLIQKTKFADTEAREYLARCLRQGSLRLQGRALRAFSKLNDPEIEAWLRPLCEHIIIRSTRQIERARMQVDAKTVAEPFMQRAALEALRDIGGPASLHIIRRARARYAGNDELRYLSFQVAEEMYWRLTGGLDQESLTTGVFRISQRG